MADPTPSPDLAAAGAIPEHQAPSPTGPVRKYPAWVIVLAGALVAYLLYQQLIYPKFFKPEVTHCLGWVDTYTGAKNGINACSFPVNAVVCTMHVLSTRFSCQAAQTYGPGAVYAPIATDRQNLFWMALTPQRVRVHPCRQGYVPKVIGDAERYSCIQQKR